MIFLAYLKHFLSYFKVWLIFASENVAIFADFWKNSLQRCFCGFFFEEFSKLEQTRNLFLNDFKKDFFYYFACFEILYSWLKTKNNFELWTNCKRCKIIMNIFCRPAMIYYDLLKQIYFKSLEVNKQRLIHDFERL